MTHVHTESYMHRAAKDVVAGWFRANADNLGYVRVGSIWSRPNRGGPEHGVWVEYPILDDGSGIDPVWDEVGLEWCFGMKLALNPEPETRWNWVPSYTTASSRGRVACVCDVALGHKGMLSTAVEIVHKHPTPDWKKDFLARHCVELVEFDAYRVMAQIGMPAELPIWRPEKRRRRQ